MMLGPYSVLLYAVLLYSPLAYFVISTYQFGEAGAYSMLMLQAWTAWNSMNAGVPTYRMPSRRWGPFRQEYYSICSAHFQHDPTCSTCACGTWRNVWLSEWEQVLFKRAPRAWRWWQTKVFTIGKRFGRTK